MSMTRDLVYDFANRLAKSASAMGIPHDRLPIEPGSDEDDRLHGLLNQVEEEALHRIAEKIRKLPRYNVVSVAPDITNVNLRKVLDLVDPYEERDGQWYRKSDGQQMTNTPRTDTHE